MRLIALFFAVLSICRPAFADGTLSTKDLLNRLRVTNPQLVQTLETSFDLDADAVGGSIGRLINKTLSGTRIGPYTVSGSLHGSGEPVHLRFTLNTAITFTDSHGGRTRAVGSAVAVDEKFESITITKDTP